MFKIIGLSLLERDQIIWTENKTYLICYYLILEWND